MAKRFKLGVDGGLACSPRPTGVEFYARSLLSCLLTEIPDWCQVHLYLPPTSGGYPFDTANAAVHIRPEMNTKLKELWLAWRCWVDSLDGFYCFGHVLPKWCYTRLIPTLHDTIFEEFPETYPPGVPERMRMEMLETVSRATAFAVNSHTTADSLRTHYAWKGPVIVTGAAHRAIFRPHSEQLSEGGRPYFLYVGRMDERKNAVKLVEAYRLLVQDGADCQLILVGPDDAGSVRLKKVLEENQMSGESIVRPGYLEDQELIRLYQGACAFVYPSLAEGFGMPILEAMACGTPVITSNRSALLEVAGDAARLIDPASTAELAQAMSELLGSESKRLFYRKVGLRRAAEFSWRSSAQVFWRALGQLVGFGPRES